MTREDWEAYLLAWLTVPGAGQYGTGRCDQSFWEHILLLGETRTVPDYPDAMPRCDDREYGGESGGA